MKAETIVSFLNKDYTPPLTQNEVREIVEGFQKIIDLTNISSDTKALWREKIDEMDAGMLFAIFIEIKKQTPEITTNNILSILKDILIT